VDFVFLSDWTDVPDWQQFCLDNKIKTASNLGTLMT
jgi:hypothetical protein